MEEIDNKKERDAAEKARKETEDFLEAVSGKWVGDETTEEIMAKIKENVKVKTRPIVKL
jgi:hypothetical protein